MRLVYCDLEGVLGRGTPFTVPRGNHSFFNVLPYIKPETKIWRFQTSPVSIKRGWEKVGQLKLVSNHIFKMPLLVLVPKAVEGFVPFLRKKPIDIGLLKSCYGRYGSGRGAND
jgi:hypothetical protein